MNPTSSVQFGQPLIVDKHVLAVIATSEHRLLKQEKNGNNEGPITK